MDLEQFRIKVEELLKSECGINRHIDIINEKKNDDVKLFHVTDYFSRIEEIPNLKVFVDILYENPKTVTDYEEIGQLSINLGFTAGNDKNDYPKRLPRYREALKETIRKNLRYGGLDMRIEDIPAPTIYNDRGGNNLYVVSLKVSNPV